MNNFQFGSDILKRMIESQCFEYFVARNGCKNEGQQSEQGVQQEDVKTTLCP